MFASKLRFVSSALGFMALTAASALATADTPTSVDVLFERRHLANVEQGQKIVYRFQRSVSDPKYLGEPFSDDIDLTVQKIADNGTRDISMQVFHGERARPIESLPDMTGNPILIFFLDRAVNNITALAGGNRMYFKGKFRDGIRDKSKIEPVKVDYAGGKVDGFKITVSPFEGDPNALRMLGYEGARFSFTISDNVPGQFVEFTQHFESPVPDSPKLDELITLAKVEKKP
jgi:hypothetical protein